MKRVFFFSFLIISLVWALNVSFGVSPNPESNEAIRNPQNSSVIANFLEYYINSPSEMNNEQKWKTEYEQYIATHKCKKCGSNKITMTLRGRPFMPYV